MTYHLWLRTAEKKLTDSGIGTARLDALLLLEFTVHKDRAYLLAHPEQPIPKLQLLKLEKLLTRRISHEPMAYIRGFSEFYGHTFVITPAVLEPRPETETMIELLKSLVHDKNYALKNKNKLRIVDVGTGSGALGISVKLLLPNCHVELLDIDEHALKVARRNVDLFTLNISVMKSDLLLNIADKPDILLCNLPYVPDSYHINEAALREPRIAIFGGPDGLDLYRKLFEQVKRIPLEPLLIFTESLPPQHDALAGIAMTCGYEKFMEDDFITVFKRTG